MDSLQFCRRVISSAASPSESVLVVCGGSNDAATLRDLGFSRVTVTNLDPHGHANFDAYPVERQDAERLTYADGAYDWAMVRAGLHHCASPHGALVEMLRVARKGVIVIEARDCLLIRLAVALGLTDDYERDAVRLGGGMGGLRGGPVPNYVYRWTEREVRKTVESACPATVNRISYHYNTQMPHNRLSHGPAWKRAAVAMATLPLAVLTTLAPSQCNEFAFVVRRGAAKSWATHVAQPLNQPASR